MASLAALLAIASHLQSAPAPANLAFLIGSWRSEEVSIRGSQEVPFVCHSVAKPALRGGFVQLDEHFEIDNNKYENHILFTENGSDVSAWWFSSASKKPIEFQGKVEAKNLVLTSAQPPLRLTFEPQNADHFKVRVELKVAGEWKLTTRADYRRVK
ncbi:MAG: hypothetical protein HONBIEJF_01835 [Fimbriimonadaceae bacterium]|nr:hypothetical protein [Fimbriimonadaceae bacterium]